MAKRRALLVTGISLAMLFAAVLAWWTTHQAAQPDADATPRALPAAPVPSPIATTPQTLPLPAGAQPTKPSTAPASLEAAVAAYRQSGQAALDAQSAPPPRVGSAGQPMTLLEALKAGDQAARERSAVAAQTSPFAQGQR